MEPASTFSAEQIEAISTRVTARLGSAAATASVEVVPPPVENAYGAAAAVLAWFNPARLQPLGDSVTGSDNDELIDRLLAASVRVTDTEGLKRWTLRPDRRVALLRELRERKMIDAALAANARPEADPVQQALDRGLRGVSIGIEHQSLKELKASYEVAAWLHAAGFAITPRPVEIAGQIEWRTLLQPFQHIAGEHFRGRQDELRQLRNFVGVVPPKSLIESTARFADRTVQSIAGAFLRRSPIFAFVVSGPGGVGKSALVARFILEHAEAHQVDRFPFAYLDFDRPDVSLDEPLTLLAEAVRQLGIEYPEVKENCDRLRAAWLEHIALQAARSGGGRAQTMARIRSAAIRDTVSSLSRLSHGDKPIVLVLDTFEEVQYAGDDAVNEVWEFLQELRSVIPPLRIVIAGRSEIDRPHVISLALSGFDEASAMAYLEARGFRDSATARHIFRRFGGSPLTLQLAADLAKDPDGKEETFSVKTRDTFYRRLSERNVQQQLFKRVLKHIHTPGVRQLAHPGLVLRRITPELILEVLAKPCHVPVKSIEDAQRLFDELKREVSLVNVDPDGALRHRQDLRLLMLGPLQEDEPDKTQTIHKDAVGFYGKRQGDIELAEEIYHRLWLDQPLEEIHARWRSGVSRYLFGAVAEFSDSRRRAFLAARLRVPINAAELADARLEDWECIVARRAAERLEDDDAYGTLKLVSERAERTDASPLTSIEAGALARLGRLDDALWTLDLGFERAILAKQSKHTTKLALAFAEIVIRFRRVRDAARAAEYLTVVETLRLSDADRLNCVARRAFLSELDATAFPSPPAGVELSELVGKTSRKTLARAREVALWVGAAPGEGADIRVASVVRAIGIPRTSDAAMRTFALALTSFDVAYSAALEREAGVLARRFQVPQRGWLTESWSTFVIEAPSTWLSKVVEAVLELGDPVDRAPLIAACQRLMGEALGINQSGVQEEAQSQARPVAPGVRSKVTLELKEELVDAISAGWSLDELRASLGNRLSRSLEAYASLGSPRQTVSDLVQVAESEGWLLNLVASLVDARPEDARIARLAARLGISTIAGNSEIDEALERILTGSERPLDLELWRARLQQIERSVCTVSVGGSRFGTGFLVGSDLVLTAGSVINADKMRTLQKGFIEVRFDVRTDDTGATLSEGVGFRVQQDGLLAANGSHGLNYALLRIDGAPGAQPIGGTMTEAAAILRRWIEVPPSAPTILPNLSLAIAHYPRAGPLQIAIGPVAGLQPLRYRIPTAPGSIGAPCFDAQSLELVALHLGREATADSMAYGVEIDAVIKDLEVKGLGHQLFARYV